jgi:hypothetical protein
MKIEPYQYANKLVKWTLLKEIKHLKGLLPASDNTFKNIARIEMQAPINNMTDQQLRDYVNLLARSINDDDYAARLAEFEIT